MHVLFLRPSRLVVLNWWWSLRTSIIILFFIMKTQRPKRFSTKIKAPASLSVMSSKLEKLSTIPHLNQNCYITHFDVATHQLRSTVLDNTFVLGFRQSNVSKTGLTSFEHQLQFNFPLRQEQRYPKV